MNQENDYIAQARSLAPFVERVLEIENLEEEINRINKKRSQKKRKKKYDKINPFNVDFDEDFSFYHE